MKKPTKPSATGKAKKSMNKIDPNTLRYVYNPIGHNLIGGGSVENVCAEFDRLKAVIREAANDPSFVECYVNIDIEEESHEYSSQSHQVLCINVQARRPITSEEAAKEAESQIRRDELDRVAYERLKKKFEEKP